MIGARVARRQGGKKIVGKAVGKLRQHIGSGRRHDQRCGRLCFADVLYRGVKIALAGGRMPKPGDHFMAGE